MTGPSKTHRRVDDPPLFQTKDAPPFPEETVSFTNPRRILQWNGRYGVVYAVEEFEPGPKTLSYPSAQDPLYDDIGFLLEEEEHEYDDSTDVYLGFDGGELCAKTDTPLHAPIEVRLRWWAYTLGISEIKRNSRLDMKIELQHQQALPNTTATIPEFNLHITAGREVVYFEPIHADNGRALATKTLTLPPERNTRATGPGSTPSIE